MSSSRNRPTWLRRIKCGMLSHLIIGTALALALGLTGCSNGSEPGTGAVAQGPVVTATAAANPTPTPDVPVVVIDPGHGGEEVGAANHGVVEKESNLDMALRVERLLSTRGVRTVLTRSGDARASGGAPDGGVTFGETRMDLQTRVDIANESRADVFVSLHSNGSSDQSLRGLEVYFDPDRSFASDNGAFAELMLASVIAELDAAGHAVIDRGTIESDCIRVRDGRCFPLFVLGPPRTITREQLLWRGVDPAFLGFRPVRTPSRRARPKCQAYSSSCSSSQTRRTRRSSATRGRATPCRAASRTRSSCGSHEADQLQVCPNDRRTVSTSPRSMPVCTPVALAVRYGREGSGE